jgi:hypothetical protein
VLVIHQPASASFSPAGTVDTLGVKCLAGHSVEVLRWVVLASSTSHASTTASPAGTADTARVVCLAGQSATVLSWVVSASVSHAGTADTPSVTTVSPSPAGLQASAAVSPAGTADTASVKAVTASSADGWCWRWLPASTAGAKQAGDQVHKGSTPWCAVDKDNKVTPCHRNKQPYMIRLC